MSTVEHPLLSPMRVVLHGVPWEMYLQLRHEPDINRLRLKRS